MLFLFSSCAVCSQRSENGLSYQGRNGRHFSLESIFPRKGERLEIFGELIADNDKCFLKTPLAKAPTFHILKALPDIHTVH